MMSYCSDYPPTIAVIYVFIYFNNKYTCIFLFIFKYNNLLFRAANAIKMGKKVEKAINSTKEAKNITSASQSVVQDPEQIKSPGFSYILMYLAFLT